MRSASTSATRCRARRTACPTTRPTGCCSIWRWCSPPPARRWHHDRPRLEWAAVLLEINRVLDVAEEYYERGEGPAATAAGACPGSTTSRCTASTWPTRGSPPRGSAGSGSRRRPAPGTAFFQGPNAAFYRTALRVLNRRGTSASTGTASSTGSATTRAARASRTSSLARPQQRGRLGDPPQRRGDRGQARAAAGLAQLLTSGPGRMEPLDARRLASRVRRAARPGRHPDAAQREPGLAGVRGQRASRDDRADRHGRRRPAARPAALLPLSPIPARSGHPPDRGGRAAPPAADARGASTRRSTPATRSSSGSSRRGTPRHRTPRYHLVDVSGGLDRLAYRRTGGEPSYEFPAYFAANVAPPMDTRFYHVDRAGRRKAGGIVNLDGVHPSVIGQGLLAHEFLKVMKEAGVPGADPDRLPAQDRASAHALSGPDPADGGDLPVRGALSYAVLSAYRYVFGGSRGARAQHQGLLERFHSPWYSVAERRSPAQETGPDRRFRRGSALRCAEHRKRRGGPVSEAGDRRSTHRRRAAAEHEIDEHPRDGDVEPEGSVTRATLACAKFAL